MTNWTTLMNQPEPKPTRQGRINTAAMKVAEQTKRGYTATADMLEAKAGEAAVLTALAQGAGVENVTEAEALEACRVLRMYAADPRYTELA